MRAVLVVAVLSLICLHAVQANRISKSAHTFTQRSKHTLQRNTVPKLSAVTSQFTEDFTIRVTFANCIDESTLTIKDFDFDENYDTTSLTLKTIVKNIQFELNGKAKPLKNAKISSTGSPYAVILREETVTFLNVISSKGLQNAKAQTTLTYMKAEDFKSITSVIEKSPESPYVGFTVSFGSKCVPAAMKESSRTLFDRFFKLSSASGKAKIFSVHPIATSGSTCRSDIGDSDVSGACPEHEAEAEFQVWATSSAPEDVVTLRTRKGLCTTFAGGSSTASTDSGFIQQGANSCGPWSQFSSCDGCFEVDGFTTSSKSEQCRTREARPNYKCKVTTECRPCRSKPCSMFASRPRSGETRTECFGCNTNNNYIGWVAPSGCKCGKNCETTGDCCQSWFYYGCQNNKYKKAEHLKGWTPRQCSSSTCVTSEPVIDTEYPSYFCYCSSNCAANNVDLCCDGKTNRDAQCKAAAPGAAPGQSPGR